MPFELTILGSSSAIPTSTKYPTAQVLNVHERFFLIDCGEGTQIQLRKYKFKLLRINRIFISHLHGDHYFGLVGLISTLSLLGNKNDIHIYSHSELKDLIQGQINYMKSEMEFEVIYHPLNFKKPQIVFEDEKISVTSFPVKHSVPTCGFLFREKKKLPNIRKEMIEKYQIPIKNIQAIKEGADFITESGDFISFNELTIPPKEPRSYAFCTDTAYFESIIDQVKEVDLLYHEATFRNNKKELANQTQHSTAEQAATIAKKANVKKLLIGHFSNRYKETDGFLQEALAVFPETFLATEGNTFNIKQTK
ncbi:MAG: ribonuclease Z [Prolixibacteraceae bacterium]|nr:ribonuclease Z [Prolixibacteraceae bacterium]MBN2775584.1 ribonuclease Z [Prolixibacteraceae bacterium]